MSILDLHATRVYTHADSKYRSVHPRLSCLEVIS